MPVIEEGPFKTSFNITNISESVDVEIGFHVEDMP
jgi:hypothetical protein